jgi:hypothetical protein
MVLIVLALLELAVILAFWRRSDPGDGDGPDHGGGPWRRPRRPPPDPPVCWEEWERQFSGDPAGSTRHPPD